MPADKPRHLQSSRDLVLSLVPLVLIVLALAGLARGCAFSPGGPSTAPPPTVDATRILSEDARRETFPIRAPQLPPGWVANSTDNATVRGSRDAAVRVGYISTAGNYLRLVQTAASEVQLVPAEVAGLRTRSGSKQVAGQVWQIYAEQDREPAWVADLGAVRLLITGSGTDAEFAELARAVLGAAPLPT